jgi:hypothetical protein
MPSAETVNRLLEAVGQGRIIEAFDEFYAENVVMQENSEPATEGFAANRAREEQFVAYVKEVKDGSFGPVIIDGDNVAYQSMMDFMGVDGTRIRKTQVAIQKWEGDKIVHERFFYDTATMVVKD